MFIFVVTVTINTGIDCAVNDVYNCILHSQFHEEIGVEQWVILLATQRSAFVSFANRLVKICYRAFLTVWNINLLYTRKCNGNRTFCRSQTGKAYNLLHTERHQNNRIRLFCIIFFFVQRNIACCSSLRSCCVICGREVTALVPSGCPRGRERNDFPGQIRPVICSVGDVPGSRTHGRTPLSWNRTLNQTSDVWSRPGHAYFTR